MKDMEHRTTAVLDRRANEVMVHPDLDSLLDGGRTVRVLGGDESVGRRRWAARRVLAGAAAAVLLVAGVVAATQVRIDDSSGDGTSTEVEVPDATEVLPKPLRSVDSIDDEEWVLATVLPEGYEFQYASTVTYNDDGTGVRQAVFGVGDGQENQLLVSIEQRGQRVAGPPLDIDGVEWFTDPDGGSPLAERVVGENVVSVAGNSGATADVVELVSGLVVVPESAMPSQPLNFSPLMVADDPSMWEVASFQVGDQTLTVSAEESDGWYCTTYMSETDEGGSGGGGCASFFDPALHLQSPQDEGSSYEVGGDELTAYLQGLASTETALVEVEWIDGQVTEVAPVNTSDRFPDALFWATTTGIALESGQTPDDLGSAVAEVRAYDANGNLLATARDDMVIVAER